MKSLKHHNVYVVLLDCVPGGTGRDVYVGMTGLKPEERFANHKKGHKKSAKVFKYGVHPLPKLYEHCNPMSYEDACRMENTLAHRLKIRGFNVYGGH